MFGKFGKILTEVKAVGSLLLGLKTDITDVKALMHDGMKLWGDMHAALAEVRALTGHTATVAAMAAQASVPTTVPIVLPHAPAPAQGLQKDLGNIVAGVDPMKGVHLPGQ